MEQYNHSFLLFLSTPALTRTGDDEKGEADGQKIRDTFESPLRGRKVTPRSPKILSARKASPRRGTPRTGGTPRNAREEVAPRPTNSMQRTREVVQPNNNTPTKRKEEGPTTNTNTNVTSSSVLRPAAYYYYEQYKKQRPVLGTADHVMFHDFETDAELTGNVTGNVTMTEMFHDDVSEEHPPGYMQATHRSTTRHQNLC